MRESMPLLLTESLDATRRELAHQHIESCAECSAEWNDVKEAWRLMGELPVLEVPPRVKARFLAEVMPAAVKTETKPSSVVPSNIVPSNVVPFMRRPAAKWLAQAAAVVVLAGASYFAGHRTTTVQVAPTQATINNMQPVSLNTAAPQQSNLFSIAESRVLAANAMNPNIEGRPNIDNVQFIDENPNDNEIGVSFDITSHVTVKGSPRDKSMVRLLSYVLENEDKMSPSSSRAIDMVRQAYATTSPQGVDPEIAQSLAKVLRNDQHQGVRIKAVETLRTLPGSVTSQTRDALIEALKSDPNPAVRMKAVDALAKLASTGGLDPAAVDTLRQKASQDDENLYVRVKAAEALSNYRQ